MARVREDDGVILAQQLNRAMRRWLLELAHDGRTARQLGEARTRAARARARESGGVGAVQMQHYAKYRRLTKEEETVRAAARRLSDAIHGAP